MMKKSRKGKKKKSKCCLKELSVDTHDLICCDKLSFSCLFLIIHREIKIHFTQKSTNFLSYDQKQKEGHW